MLSSNVRKYFSFCILLYIDCVRRQYSNYTIGNRDGDPSKFFRVDGNITLGENIADHGGLKIAEIAYEKWLTTQSNGERDVVLPALENFRWDGNHNLLYLTIFSSQALIINLVI